MYALWQELKIYCEEAGEVFHPEWQVGSDAALVGERAGFRSQAQFLKGSVMLSHYLTSFALSGWLNPAWQCIRETVAPCRTLDYLAGIGETGLHLAGKGYDVEFYDAGACAKYLQWRCDRRGLQAHKRVPSGGYDLVTMVGVSGFMDTRELLKEVDRAAGLGAIVAFDVNARAPSTPPWSQVDVGEIVEKITEKYALLRHAVYDEIHHVLVVASGSTAVNENQAQGDELLADAETTAPDPETDGGSADASEPRTDYGEGDDAGVESAETAAAELPDENPGAIEDQEESDV